MCELIRKECDDTLNCYCILLVKDSKLYFIHSLMPCGDLSKENLNSLLTDSLNDSQLLVTEDLESINNSYHVDFDNLNAIIEQFKLLDDNLFVGVFYHYYMEGTDEFGLNDLDNYRDKCIAYQRLFGASNMGEEIIFSNEVKASDLEKKIIYSHDFGYDTYLFPSTESNKTKDIVAYIATKSFRPVLFNTNCSGLITDEFLFKTLSDEQFAKKISLFYGVNDYSNPSDIQTILKAKERKHKIKILLSSPCP